MPHCYSNSWLLPPKDNAWRQHIASEPLVALTRNSRGTTHGSNRGKILARFEPDCTPGVEPLEDAPLMGVEMLDNPEAAL